MINKKFLRKSLLTLSVSMFALSLSVNAETEDFTNIYSFGGSFSTISSSSTPPGAGASPSWAAYMITGYGKEEVLYYPYTGGRLPTPGNPNANNFATGGESTAMFAQQITDYKNTVGKFDGNALYLLYEGPNDIASADYQNVENLDVGGFSTNNQINPTDTPNVFSFLYARTTNVANAVKSLSDGGAKFIVVLNHIDEDIRQGLIFPGFGGGLMYRRASEVWNKLLPQNIRTVAGGANVILVDYFKLGEEAVNEPTKFFPTGVSFYGADGTHTSFKGSELMAQLVRSVIEAPTRVSIARELPISLGDIYSDKLATSEYKNNFANKSSGDYNFYVDGDFSREETKTFSFKKLGYKNEINNFTTGASRSFYDDAVVGVGLNASRNSTKFKEETGKMDIESLGGFIYGAKDVIKGVRAFASAGMSNLKYKLKRNVTLGLLNRNHEGDTKGSHVYFNLGVKRGFEFNQNTSIVPFAMFSYQTVSMKDFKESGDVNSTTMSYSIPKRKSSKSKIGAVLSKEFGFDSFVASPYLSAMWVHEFEDVFKDRARGKNSDFDFSYFSVPTYKAKKDYIKLDLGLKANLHNTIDVRVQYGTEIGVKRTKTNHLANVGVNIYM
jgi:outer membrane lipase/esterase